MGEITANYGINNIYANYVSLKKYTFEGDLKHINPSLHGFVHRLYGYGRNYSWVRAGEVWYRYDNNDITQVLYRYDIDMITGI